MNHEDSHYPSDADCIAAEHDPKAFDPREFPQANAVIVYAQLVLEAYDAGFELTSYQESPKIRQSVSRFFGRIANAAMMSFSPGLGQSFEHTFEQKTLPPSPANNEGWFSRNTPFDR